VEPTYPGYRSGKSAIRDRSVTKDLRSSRPGIRRGGRGEIPGIHKENLDTNLTDNVLRITGHKEAVQEGRVRPTSITSARWASSCAR